MAYFSRAAWGAEPARSTSAWRNGRPDSLTVHAVGGTVGVRDNYLATVKSIQSHAFGKGLADIDYNFLVDLHGNVYEGRGAGVQSGAQHVGNATSLAVCYLDYGDGDVPFTDAAKAAILALRDQHVRPGAPVHPHKFWNNGGKYDTGCPGNEIAAWCYAGAPAGTGAATGGFLPMLNDAQQAELLMRMVDTHNKVSEFFADERDLGRKGNAFNNINVRVQELRDIMVPALSADVKSVLSQVKATTAPAGASLTDNDVERIAQRVIALLHDKTA